MKRRLLSAFLAVMMVLTMAPVAFAASDGADDTVQETVLLSEDDNTNEDNTVGETVATESVAQVDDATYTTLQEAISVAQANNGTVKLLKDVDLSAMQEITGTLTIDLNGHTISNGTITNNRDYMLQIDLGAKLELVGNAENSAITDRRTNETGTITAICVLGELHVKGDNLTISRDKGIAIKVDESGADKLGKLTVESGTISSQQAVQNWGISTINGGTFNGYVDSAAYSNIGGQLTINSGTFANDVYTWQLKYKGTWPTVAAKIDIAGGTFKGTIAELYADGTNGLQPVTNVDFPTDGSCPEGVVSISGGAFTDIANAVKYAADNATIKLAGDVKEDVTIPAGKTITLDLNGKTLTNKTGHTITNNGTLTIIGSGTVDNVTHGKAAVYNAPGSVANLYGGKYTRSQEKGTYEPYSNGGNSFYVLQNQGTMTIGEDANSTVSVSANGGYSSLIADGYQDGSKKASNVADPMLTINGGNFSGGINTVKVDECGKAVINGGTFTNYVQHSLQNWNVCTVNGGAFTSTDRAAIYNGAYNDYSSGELTVTGGMFSSKVDVIQTYSKPGTIAISGGHFTSDPSKYLATGKYVIKSDIDGYTHTVTDTKPAEAPVFVQENTEAKVGGSVSEDIKNQMTPEALDKTEVNGVADAVKEDALLKNAGIDVKNAEVTKVDAEVKVDVQLTGGDLSDGAKDKTLTFKAEPVATVTVTKADGSTEVKDKVEVPNSMLNGKPITVKLPLPAGFVPEQIKHTSSDRSVEYFLKTAKRGAKLFTVDSDNCAVFEITHFSTFELSGTVTYVEPSSGGSSSGKTTYKVTTSAVNNGGVNASPSSAEKGATITITLSPDKGYKLDKLTVTDGSGKTVSTVKKSDTVYTFTMPASAVKVGVSYVKATETPSKTKFNDVSANDWFASAVDYVTGKGMMNGTADNTFSPKANTTRGMVVTVLYRLENQPSTSAASFTDVAFGAYYANAVAWANANGIVSGYGSGKFGPNDKVTREQLAAILYRYAQYKKYDVSVGEDTNILSYDDAQSISSYAIPAIQWACGAGVVTGKSGSKLDPKGNATRAEVAAMLMRFCENVK